MMMRGVGLLILDLVVNTALVLLLIAVAPISLPILAVMTAPLFALGSTSDPSQVGIPPSGLRRYRPLYVLPLLPYLFIALWGYVVLLGQPFVFFAIRIAVFVQGLSPPPHLAQNEAPKHQGKKALRPTSDAQSTSDDARYRDHASVWAALEGDGDRVKRGDVKLLSLRWLHSLADDAVAALSRRQELPEEAFLEPEDLRRIQRAAKLKFDFQGWWEAASEWGRRGSWGGLLPMVSGLFQRKRNPDNLVPVVAVSYVWLEAAHPDRYGRQIRLLCSKLDKLCGGRGLLGACKAYGFSDMGVFIDWGSGYQKDPALWRGWMSDKGVYVLSDEELRDLSNGEQLVAERRAYESSRTDEQKAAFDRMLHNTMDIWYAHAGVTVVLLTLLPEELPDGFDTTRIFHTRGWTTYERCSAELAKSFNLKVALWRLVIDVADADGGAARRLPTTPGRMVELLEKCQFTNGADKGPVLALYQKTASAVLGSSERLDYMGLPLKVGDPWCSPARLGEALNLCTGLRELIVKGTQLTDEGVVELAATLDDNALPALDTLDFACHRFGTPGVEALCDMLCRGVAPNLHVLAMSGSPDLIEDAAAEAIATAFTTGTMPPQLIVDISGGNVHTRGAQALATALPAAGVGCRVLCFGCRIGFWGQVALFRALESKHGWSMANTIAVSLNPPPAPGFLPRGLSLGARRVHESGRPFL